MSTILKALNNKYQFARHIDILTASLAVSALLFGLSMYEYLDYTDKNI